MVSIDTDGGMVDRPSIGDALDIGLQRAYELLFWIK